MAWPDFVIAGAQRSGTSWLWKNLAEVPGFDMATEKEPAFFSMPERYEMGLPYYRGSFRDDGALKGDATADYIYIPHAIHLIRKDSPWRRPSWTRSGSTTGSRTRN